MRAIALMSIALVSSTCASTAELKAFAKRIPADPSGRVQIQDVAGSVTISTWDRSEIEVDAKEGAGVERVDVTHAGGRDVIQVVLAENSGRDGAAILEVRVPASSQLEVSTVSAPIRVKGVHGMAHLYSVSGDIRADVTSSDIEVKTVSGDVSLNVGGQSQSADMRACTVSGDLSINHGSGDIDACTTSGDLTVILDAARIVRLHTTSGDVEFRGHLLSKGRIEAETISGSVSVEAATETGYQYDASTFSGDISNCFGQDAVRKSQFTPSSELIGARGAPGGGSVTLKTLSGDIELCDHLSE